MPRTLTNPAPQPAATHQHISGLRFTIPAVRDVDDMVIRKQGVSLWYEVVTYDVEGNITGRKQRVVPFADWPAGFRTDVRNMYSRVQQHAESEGLFLGPGTDEPLE